MIQLSDVMPFGNREGLLLTYQLKPVIVVLLNSHVKSVNRDLFQVLFQLFLEIQANNFQSGLKEKMNDSNECP